jgi:hypothetical protein
MGDKEDFHIGGLFVEDVERVGEVTTPPLSSMVLCASPVLSELACDVSADGGLSPRDVRAVDVVRSVDGEFDPWTWPFPFKNWSPIRMIGGADFSPELRGLVSSEVASFMAGDMEDLDLGPPFSPVDIRDPARGGGDAIPGCSQYGKCLLLYCTCGKRDRRELQGARRLS